MTQDARQRWQQRYDAALAGGKVRDADFTTLSGVEVDPVYGPADESAVPGFERIGWPGEFPFTRGLHATGYRGRAWTIRQFAGFGNAQQTNERYKMILAEGGGGLSVAFDMPTLMGRDSDDPRALGEVGHCGVAIDSAADMDVLFDDIPLDDVDHVDDDQRPRRPGVLHVPGRGRAPGRRHRQAQRHPADRHLQGVHRAEGVAVRARAAPAPDRRPDGVLRREHPGVQAALASPATTSARPARPPRRSSRSRWPTASPTSSWACPAAWTSSSSPRACPSSSTPTSTSSRRSPSSAPPAASGPAGCATSTARQTDKAQWLRFHTQTAGVSLTAQQPDNNVVRTAVEALAAVLGGTQSLHTNALDEVLALPSEKAAQIALRTQQVIMEETGVVNVADPLGGSWYVEALTDEIEARPRRSSTRIKDDAARDGDR